MPVTQEHAQMIATLVIAARPHGARQWDAAGVMAQLAKVKHLDLAEVMIAAGRAARDRDLETPGALGNPSAPCWIERPIERAVPTKTTPAERCGICARPRQACESAPRFADDEHIFEPDFKHKRPGDAVALIVADVKAEVAASPVVAEPKSLDDLLPSERNEHAQAARDQVADTPEPDESTAEPDPNVREQIHRDQEAVDA